MKHYFLLMPLLMLVSACTPPMASPEQQIIAQSLTERGYVYLRKQQQELALGQFNQAIKTDGRNIRAYQGKGIALNTLKRHQEADEAYEMGLSIDDASPALLNNYGMSQIMQKNYARAVDVLAPAVVTFPTDATLRNNLALAYCMLGQEDQAREHYNSNLREKETEENIAFCRQARSLIPQQKPQDASPKKPNLMDLFR